MPVPIAKIPPAPPNDPAGRPSGTGRDTRVESKLAAACNDMEALFIHHMLSEMRKSVPKSGFIDGGRAEEIYTSLMDAELAKEMARSGGLGLSAILQEQLSGPAAVFRKKASGR
ncbi:MAG: rod-binding protein [Hyphomicrobiales bacterium]